MESRNSPRHHGSSWNNWNAGSETIPSSVPGYPWDCRHPASYATSHPGTPNSVAYVNGSIAEENHLMPPMRHLHPYREASGQMTSSSQNHGYENRWYTHAEINNQYPEDTASGAQVNLGYDHSSMGYFAQPVSMYQPGYNVRQDKSSSTYAPSPGHEFDVRPDSAPIAPSPRKTNSYARSTSPPDMMYESADDRQSASPASQSSMYTVTCEYCGFVLTGAHAKGNLKRHQAGDSCTSLTHRKEYPCINCPGKVYKRSDALRNHQRRKGCTPL